MRALLLVLAVCLLFPWPVVAADPGPLVAEAQAVIQRVRDTMMREMQTAMQLGPTQAIGVCRHLAPEIAQQIERETGWEVQRPALRVRNPANKPTEDERSVLLSFVSRSVAGQDISRMNTMRRVTRDGVAYAHFMQAIPTFEPCLACHGDNIDPGLHREIRKLYPEDQATGYEVGDLRGAFSLYRALHMPDSPTAAEPATTAPDDIGYRPTPREGAIGDPVEGRRLFERHCQSCHAPDNLSVHLFGAAAPESEADVCSFLKTHGITDKAQDCDVIAYLQDLALFLAENR